MSAPNTSTAIDPVAKQVLEEVQAPAEEPGSSSDALKKAQKEEESTSPASAQDTSTTNESVAKKAPEEGQTPAKEPGSSINTPKKAQKEEEKKTSASAPGTSTTVDSIAKEVIVDGQAPAEKAGPSKNALKKPQKEEEKDTSASAPGTSTTVDSVAKEVIEEGQAPVEEAGPSKNALKKAQKEEEKRKKKEAAKARELAERQKKEESDAQDVSKEDYGELPLIGSKEFKATGEKRVELADIAEHADQTVTFRCWVENARVQSAKLAFLNLRQDLNTVQAVVAASDKLSKQMVKFAGNISTESTLAVTGLVKKTPEPINSATIKDYEIHVKRVFVEAKAEVPLPLQVEDAERPLPSDAAGEEEQDESGKPLVTLNTRLNNRTIDLRAKINQAIFKVKSGVCALFQEFLSQKDFILVQTPKILGGASESGASVFELKYFDRTAALAQSPQLYKQMLIASRFKRVMEIGPVFRAENSNTARHLTEFTGLDLEMEFHEDYHDVVALLEELMLFIFNGLKTRYGKETDLVRASYHVDEFKLPAVGQVPRLTFAEGVKMLREAGEEIGDNDDLSTPQEKHLGRLVLEKYNSDFYTLDKFPLAVRPFYTMPAAESPTISNSYDMFMRGQEICSGAQRIHTPELLKEKMRAFTPPVDPDSDGVRDYVNCFRYGCPPHAGGGFGLERIVCFWLGLPNIRLTSLFPRDPTRVVP